MKLSAVSHIGVVAWALASAPAAAPAQSARPAPRTGGGGRTVNSGIPGIRSRHDQAHGRRLVEPQDGDV